MMNTHKQFSNRPSATHRFTLIELAIDVAVVALFAALLIPAISHVQEKASTANCIDNKKKLMETTLQYLNEYDGVFLGMQDGYGSWITSFQRWMKKDSKDFDFSEFGCPNVAAYKVSGKPAASFNVFAMRTSGQVVPHQYFGWKGANGKAAQIVYTKKIKEPASYIQALDTWRRDQRSQYFSLQIKPGASNGLAHFRHEDRNTAGFLDGHVDTVTPDEYRDHMTSFKYADPVMNSDLYVYLTADGRSETNIR